MRAEPLHILDVPAGQETQGKCEAKQRIERGGYDIEKPYALRVGKSETPTPGFVGIFAEPLASSR